jgi:hypothetical protein
MPMKSDKDTIYKNHNEFNFGIAVQPISFFIFLVIAYGYDIVALIAIIVDLALRIHSLNSFRRWKIHVIKSERV